MGGQKGHTFYLYLEICNRRMNCRDRTTFRKVPNFEKSSLNIETGLGVDFRKSIFGSKGREPEKERDANMKTFHVSNPFFLDLFSKVEVNNFKRFTKCRILLGIIIFFESWPIYPKVKFCYNINCI